MQEIWKRVPYSQFYCVSNLGNLKVMEGIILRSDGKPYTVKEHIVKPYMTRNGYMVIHGHYDLNGAKSLHRLVLETFQPRDDSDTLDVNHIDGNKSNNCLENLEWCTKQENMAHAHNIGLFHPEDRYGEKHPMCKLSADDVVKIKELLLLGDKTQHEIAELYGVSDTTIHEIKFNKTRKKG